jgi:hypothetical protein
LEGVKRTADDGRAAQAPVPALRLLPHAAARVGSPSHETGQIEHFGHDLEMPLAAR